MNELLSKHRVGSLQERQIARAVREAALRVDRASQAQAIAQEVVSTVQAEVHRRLAAVVTRCLEAVFEHPYTFEVRFDKKRGRTEARLVFTRDGREYDPTEESGLGIVDVAAFALRLACLVLTGRRRLLVLDEPMKWVDAKNMERVGDLLTSISREMGVQIILVTHDEGLEVGKVIRLGAEKPRREGSRRGSARNSKE